MDQEKEPNYLSNVPSRCPGSFQTTSQYLDMFDFVKQSLISILTGENLIGRCKNPGNGRWNGRRTLCPLWYCDIQVNYLHRCTWFPRHDHPDSRKSLAQAHYPPLPPDMIYLFSKDVFNISQSRKVHQKTKDNGLLIWLFLYTTGEVSIVLLVSHAWKRLPQG